MDDDIPIANIIKRIIENVTKSQEKVANKEMVNIDEETEIDEEPIVIVMRSIVKFVLDRVKNKKKQKTVTPKSTTKITEMEKKKSLKEKPMKKRKVERKVIEKKFLKRKIIQTSGSETYDEQDVLDIVTSSRRNNGGKRILVNIPTAQLDNVSFHSETSVQKWKYVF